MIYKKPLQLFEYVTAAFFNTCMTWSGMWGSFAGYRRFRYSLLQIWI